MKKILTLLTFFCVVCACFAEKQTITKKQVDPQTEQGTALNKERVVRITGKVFLDENRNGILDKGEKGMPDVYVSNGIDIIPSGKDGSYTLEVNKAVMPFVFITKPTGYQASNGFYKSCLDLGKSANVDFGLVPYKIPDAEEKGLTFFHISDVHTAMFPTEGMIKVLKPQFEELVRELKKANGQFILNTGDIVNHGSPEQWKSVVDYVLPALTVPTWHVVGNHDFDGKGYTDLTSYHKLFGPNYYSFNYLDNHFIVLDDSRKRDAVFDAQVDWFKKDFQIFSAEYKIFIVDHTGGVLRWLKRNDDAFFRKNRNKITAQFEGHSHSCRVWKWENILIVRAPMFSCGAGLIDGMDFGYVKVNIKGDKVTTRLCFFDSDKELKSIKLDSDAADVKTGGDWPMFQHDPAHTGYTEDKVIPPLKLKWMRKLSDNFHMSSPIVVKGMVLAGLPNEDLNRGGVVALDAATGKTVWKYQTETAVRCTPCYAEGKVFFSTSAGKTFAVKLDNGEKVWEKNSAYQCHGSPAVVNKTLFAALNCRLEAVNIETGKTFKNSSTTQWPYANFISPAINKDGFAFYGGIGYGLFCFDPDLKTVWHWKKKGKIAFPGSHSSVVADGDQIFWAANSSFDALDAKTMKINWRFSWENRRIVYPTPVSTPCLDSEKVYFASEVDGKLYALDKKTGNKLWEYQTGVSLRPFGNRNSYDPCIFANPAISKDIIYLGAHDGYLHVVDTNTGKGVFKYYLGTPITSSVAISGNTVFVTGVNGYLYCFVGQN